MPFLQISRDRRGYEYFALVHTSAGRRGRSRQRLLYWFRTPPNVKVGRSPFDEEAMRAIERQYPDIAFDWDALRKTPMPPPSAEHWRERRRAEKLFRQFRAEDERRGEGSEDEAAAAPPSVHSASLSDDDSPAAEAAATVEDAEDAPDSTDRASRERRESDDVLRPPPAGAPIQTVGPESSSTRTDSLDDADDEEPGVAAGGDEVE